MSREEAFDREQLLKCGYGEMFGPGNAQLPTPNMLMLSPRPIRAAGARLRDR